MVERFINSIQTGNIWRSIKIRLRFVFRIKNKNVYTEYLKCREYDKLFKKYNYLISQGVDDSLPRKRGRKIWICWLQGLENAPDLVKSCVNSINQMKSDYEIVLLTSSNIKQYIELPGFIEEKREKGIIPFAQYTDILRTALLCKYGGGWIDSSVLCTANELPQYIEDAPLFVYRQMDLYSYNKDLTPIVASNWLMFSESNNPIMLLTLKLLYKYWEEHNKLTHYFIYHLFFSMATRRYPKIWNEVPVFNNHSPHTMQQELSRKYNKRRWLNLVSMSAFHKLNRRLDFSNDSESLYSYIVSRYSNWEDE